MPWVTIVDSGLVRRSSLDWTASSPRESKQLFNQDETTCITPTSLSNVPLIETPSKAGTKACSTPNDRLEKAEHLSRTCFSPDSVMAWPGSDNDTSPVKRQLDLRSPPTSPPSSAEGDLDDMTKRRDMSHTLVESIIPDTSSSDFEDAQNDHLISTITSHVVYGSNRRVSFADERGSPLKEIRFLEPPDYRRMVLLLLSPNDRKFEFLHLEYPLDDNTTVQALVDQIPKLAANPVFRRFTFSCLARTSKNEKLDNNKLIGDYELAENELLLGILMGYAATEIGTCAVPLLLNGDIIKAVNRAKKSGKGLKTVRSGHEWRRRGKPRKIPKSWTRKGPASRRSSLDETTQSTIAAFSSVSMEENSYGEEDAVTQFLVDFQQSNTCNPRIIDTDRSSSRDDTEARENQECDQRATKGSSLESNARSVVDQLVADENDIQVFDFELVSDPRNSRRDPDALSEDASVNTSIDEGMEDLPDMDNPECVYPDLLRDYLGGGTEKAVFWIHAMSIAAVGYLTTMAMR